MDNSYLKFKSRKMKRRWVHEFSEERVTFGEFYHLYRDARLYSDKFYDYLRMTKDTFDTLLDKLRDHLNGPGINYRERISPE